MRDRQYQDRQYQDTDSLTQSDSALDPAVPVVHAETLFGQGRQVTIRHAGEAYVLRCTKQNKLLLTKPAASGGDTQEGRNASK